MQSTHQALSKEIADHFAALPQVTAVALSGSRGGNANAVDAAWQSSSRITRISTNVTGQFVQIRAIRDRG
jgi:hypothetical protein